MKRIENFINSNRILINRKEQKNYVCKDIVLIIKRTPLKFINITDADADKFTKVEYISWNKCIYLSVSNSYFANTNGQKLKQKVIICVMMRL